MPTTDGVIRLRAWEPTDAEWYAAVTQDELIQRFTSEPPSLTGDEVREAILNLREQGSAAGLVICDALTGERLRNIALRHESGVGEISYWLAAAARGKGAAGRALRLLSRWAFDRLGLTELRLWTHADNTASRRVAQRAGFQRDPQRDQERQVKSTTWATLAYRLAPVGGYPPSSTGSGSGDPTVVAGQSRAGRRHRPRLAVRRPYPFGRYDPTRTGETVAGVYGRDEDTWETLTSTGLEFLIERARLQAFTTYTELNTVLVRRTGLPGFDFSRQEDRAAMGHLLGLIVERDFPTSHCMLSALVKYLNENDAGSGFYALATDLGLLPKGVSAKQKERFWVEQLTRLFAHYGKRGATPATPGNE